jgi:hypothetical protein
MLNKITPTGGLTVKTSGILGGHRKHTPEVWKGDRGEDGPEPMTLAQWSVCNNKDSWLSGQDIWYVSSLWEQYVGKLEHADINRRGGSYRYVLSGNQTPLKSRVCESVGVHRAQEKARRIIQKPLWQVRWVMMKMGKELVTGCFG